MHRYVKPLSRTTAPNRLICCAPEVDITVHHSGCDGIQYKAKAVWYTYSRRSGSKWYGTEKPIRVPRADWWDLVDSKIPRGSRLTVIAPSSVDLCTLTGFWRRLDDGYYTLCDSSKCKLHGNGQTSETCNCWQGMLILGNPPEIIHVRGANGSIVLLSRDNYTQLGWDDLGQATGVPIEPTAANCVVSRDDEYDVSDRVCILTRYFRRTISEWVASDSGPWGDTIGQLSTSLWRKNHYTERVCRHANETAIELEKSARHGGRAEVWCYCDLGNRKCSDGGWDATPPESVYGGIDATITRCDVSSQYPSLLATERFPTRLVEVVDNPSVEWLSDALRYWGVIADVTIRTRIPEFPAKRRDGAIYPCGRFTTTLAGPELRLGLDTGCIETVHRASKYNIGRPLKSYADFLLRERASRNDAKDYAGELFIKTLSTAIGGKFAQRTRHRVMRPGIVSPWGRWGRWGMVDKESQYHDYLTIAGVVYEMIDVVAGGKLLAALYAYLTSYGRVQMAAIRQGLPIRSVVSQDTDGIWVLPEALMALRRDGMTADRIPGKLREMTTYGYARFITPRHYYIDGKWVLSGYRYGCRSDDSGSICEFRESNPIRGVAFRPPGAMVHREYRRHFASLKRGVHIGSDGWLIPQTIGV